MVGVVVGGGTSESLAPLGVPEDVAFAPFAARYRLGDFARTTLRNSGLRVLDGTGGRAAPRPGARLLPALHACAGSAPYEPSTPVVVLVADHILDADLRPVLVSPVAVDSRAGRLPARTTRSPVQLRVALGSVVSTPRTAPFESTVSWQHDEESADRQRRARSASPAAGLTSTGRRSASRMWSATRTTTGVEGS